MNEINMLKIVEQYNQQGESTYGDIKIMRVADYKTVFVEQSDGQGRSIVLTEYLVGGNTYWAGYSQRSETVYVSLAARSRF